MISAGIPCAYADDQPRKSPIKFNTWLSDGDPVPLPPVEVWASYDDGDDPKLLRWPEFTGGLGDPGGGGGGFTGNRGDNTDVRDASKGQDDCGDTNPTAGNPVVLSTGDKIEVETDFASAGEMPLTLTRTYDHFWSYNGLFGKFWVSSFDFSLVWQANGSDPIGIIYAQRPDGRRIKFYRVGTSNRWDEDKPDPIAYITMAGQGSSTLWTLHNENDGIETYDFGGRTLTVRNAYGVGWTFTYNDSDRHYLTRVTHDSGRYVQFGWNTTTGQLLTVTAPDNSQFTYSYTVLATGESLLASTTTPSASGNPAVTTTYLYEDPDFPGGLTGKSYNGVRYSTFAYDDYGRATLSEHAGNVEKFTFSYGGDPPTDPPNPPDDPPEPGGICYPGPPPHCEARPINPALIGSAAEVDRVLNEKAIVTLVNGTTTTTTETNPLLLQTTYTFSDGQLTSVVSPAGAYCSARSRSQTYDANGNLDIQHDFNNNTTDWNYAANGQLQQVSEGVGSAVQRTTTYAWDPTFNRQTSATLTGNSKSTYAYDAHSRLRELKLYNLSNYGVANQTHTWTYTYTYYTSPSWMVQKLVIDGPQTGTTDQITYQFSTAGDLSSVSNTLGHTTTYTLYNSLGQPGTVTGPNGDMTQYAYYPGGMLKSVTTYPDGVHASVANYTYDKGLVKTVAANGVTTTYVWDSARRLTSESRNEANGTATRKYFYDLAGNTIRTEVYRGSVLHARAYTDYDGLNRVRQRRGNYSQLFKYTYDPNSNLKTTVDSYNKTTTYYYDALNRVSSSNDPRNGLTRFSYDAADRIKSVTDPRNFVTQYSVDGFGQTWQEISPDRGTTNYGYNSWGSLASMTRVDINESFTYDGIGRLRTIFNGYTQTLTYDSCTYGKLRLCSATDPYSSITYTYNKPGGVTSRHDQSIVDGVSATFITGYTYDTYGHLQKITYPNNQVATYTWTANQPTALSVTINGANSTVLNAANWEPYGGPLAAATFGNGLAFVSDHDLDQRAINRMVSSGGVAPTYVQRLSYGYDADYRMTSITDGVTASQSQTYGYDELSRLKSVTGGSGITGNLSYDPNGNRLGLGAWSFGYESGSNQITLANVYTPISVQTDGRGNVKEYDSDLGSWGFNYDGFNRLQSRYFVTVGRTNSTTGTYTYNMKSERVGKVSSYEGTFRYTYAEDQTLLAERLDGSNQWTNYLWFAGEPVGMVRGITKTYLHADHAGRPQVGTNASKQIVWKMQDDVFGNRTIATDNIGGLNLGYPGQYYDAESALWYNVNRTYDPMTGRYLQVDPIGLGGGINPYVYGGNNPVGNVDPLGLDWEYYSGSGDLFQNGSYVGTGYAGHGAGVNNAWMSGFTNIGPLPAGQYAIGPQRNNVTLYGRKLLGSMRLTPARNNSMYGRAGFLIHGDNSAFNQTASNGCPVFDRSLRDQIGWSGDNVFVVYDSVASFLPVWW